MNGVRAGVFIDSRLGALRSRTIDNGGHQVLVRKPGVCERSNSAGCDLRWKVVMVVVLTEGSVGERAWLNECGAG